MAFIRDFDEEIPIAFSPELKQACGDYRYYVEHILKPASRDLELKVRANTVALHEAYGANLICAHSVDYLLAVRKVTADDLTNRICISAYSCWGS